MADGTKYVDPTPTAQRTAINKKQTYVDTLKQPVGRRMDVEGTRTGNIGKDVASTVKTLGKPPQRLVTTRTPMEVDMSRPAEFADGTESVVDTSAIREQQQQEQAALDKEIAARWADADKQAADDAAKPPEKKSGGIGGIIGKLDQ